MRYGLNHHVHNLQGLDQIMLNLISVIILECALPNLGNSIWLVGIAATLIFTAYLIYYTFTNLDNPRELETMPKKWVALILWILFVASGGWYFVYSS